MFLRQPMDKTSYQVSMLERFWIVSKFYYATNAMDLNTEQNLTVKSNLKRKKDYPKSRPKILLCWALPSPQYQRAHDGFMSF